MTAASGSDRDGLFTGTTAIVTGAASGIGLACGRALLARGATVLALDLSRAVADLDLATWQRSLSINLTSHLLVLQAVIPRMTAGGSIVIMGSRNVPAPGPGAAAYSCAKAAATQLARVAALELAGAGIRVNVIHPDAVFDTAIWTDEVLARSAARYGMTVQQYKTKNLLKAEISQDDVAAGVCAVLGPAFARTTGAQIPIDGGNDRVI